jgi:hypothetical protein
MSTQFDPDLAREATCHNIYNTMRPLEAHQHGWMVNGRTMTWADFLDELAPGEDNPLRTFLTLKYQR